MSGVVIDLIRLHGTDDADVIGDTPDLRQDTADFETRLSEFLELMLRCKAF